MAKLRVFLEIEFLKSYLNELRKELGVVEFPKNVLFVKEILKNCDLYVNLDIDAITDLMKSENDNDITNLCLRTYSNGTASPIKSCVVELEIIKNESINNSKIQPHIILLGQNRTYANTLAIKTGIICIPNDFNFFKVISEVVIKPIPANTVIEFSKYTTNLVKSNFLIIDDPYIDQIPYNITRSLIENLTSSKSKLLNIVFIIREYNKYNPNLEEKLTTQKKWIDEVIAIKSETVLIHIVIAEVLQNSIRVHDRHIIANTFWITCGYGFNLEYSSQTSWNYFPLGIYYSAVVDRIEFLLRFINDPNIHHEIKKCFAIEN